MPAGHRARAIDSARLRCAALAGANAAVILPPRRDAVAPMKTMFPSPATVMAGITSREQRKAPSAFTRHDASNCSAVMFSTSANAPLPALNRRVSTSPSSTLIAAKVALTDASLATSNAYPRAPSTSAHAHPRLRSSTANPPGPFHHKPESLEVGV